MHRKITILLFFLVIVQGWANDVERPKVGVVLAGGGAKGCAHVGTLKMLDSLKIPVDYIVGTSMGGIVGALYSIGYSGRDLENLTEEIDWLEIFSDRPPRKELPYFEKKDTGKYQLQFGLEGFKPVTQSGLIYGQKVYLLFAGLTWEYEKVDDFDQLPIPFRCVAVNLINGDEVILKKGSLAKAMRSTMAIPTVFSPVEWGDSLLVDGGLINNLPIDVVEDMGADIIIAVDVASFLERKKLNSALGVMEQSFNLVSVESWKKNKGKADIFITPDMSNFSAADFEAGKIREILHAGDVAAKASLPQLVQLQKKLAHYQTKAEPVHEKQNSKSDLPRIYGINVSGNKSLPFAFIYNLLGIQPGDELDVQLLDKNIMRLYGLGYFELVNYEIDPMPDNMVQLNINVKEHSVRKLRLGIRYDDCYKLVAVAGVQATNFIIPGMRVENELQFAGLLKHHLKAYYPSRNLSFPVYPFVHSDYQDIPVKISDGYGNHIASYDNRSATLGMGGGFLFSNSINIELSYQLQFMNTKPEIAWSDPSIFPSWKDRLHALKVKLNFDTLDDVLLPHNGFLLDAEFETGIEEMGSEIDYSSVFVSANFYKTFAPRHTTRVFGFWGDSRQLPIYKIFMMRDPSMFVGMEYDQLRGNRLSLLRFDYRYEFKRDIFIKFMVNTAFNIEIIDLPTVIRPHDLWGYGVGLKLLSPIGPVEFIYSQGSENLLGEQKMRSLTYLKLGYQF